MTIPNDLTLGSFNRLYSRYKRSAKRRGYVFLLTRKSFKSLTSKCCTYCGIMPQTIGELTPGSKNTQPYIYNGIDRINSTIGYIEGNVVTCCTICNFMKGKLPHELFIVQIQRIHDYQRMNNEQSN